MWTKSGLEHNMLTILGALVQEESFPYTYTKLGSSGKISRQWKHLKMKCKMFPTDKLIQILKSSPQNM